MIFSHKGKCEGHASCCIFRNITMAAYKLEGFFTEVALIHMTNFLICSLSSDLVAQLYPSSKEFRDTGAGLKYFGFHKAPF